LSTQMAMHTSECLHKCIICWHTSDPKQTHVIGMKYCDCIVVGCWPQRLECVEHFAQHKVCVRGGCGVFDSSSRPQR
jgi:hypothetical protein